MRPILSAIRSNWEFIYIVIAILFAVAFPAVANGQEVKPKDAPQFGRGYKPLTPERRRELYAASVVKHGGRIAMLAKFQALPTAFDSRDKGWVLPVGDQGNCGSCYLYSTVYGTLTSAFVKAGYGKADGSFVMSVQFGMDCHNFGGCDGGNGTEVIDWVIRNGWPAEKWTDTSGVSHSDYGPYLARSGICREPAGAKRWKPSDWGFVSASPNRAATTLEIKTALFNYGPLNVSLDAGGQFSNGTGTITSLGNAIDHEIELVAYDDTKGAFLLKNQWSTSWGNGGYRWVTYAAAAHLVDVFFVSVAPLPPPPPPDPPDPIPPTPGDDSITIVVRQNGKSTVTVITLTPAASIIWPKDTPKWLKDAVEKQKTGERPQADPVPKETPEPPMLPPKVEPKKTGAIAPPPQPPANLTIAERVAWWERHYPQYASKP